MKESRFINLTDYCVVEYMFEDAGSTNFITDDFVLLKNDRIDVHQIFNEDGSLFTTKNIRDLTVTNLTANKLVYLDSEKIPNYVDVDDQIEEVSVTGYNVVMDRVRFHFVSGFNFNDFASLVLSVRHEENDGKTNVFGNILFSPETQSQLLTFNNKPLFLGGAVYDRYVEFLVPSIKNVNDEYQTAPTPATTFAAAITPNDTDPAGTGFIINDNFDVAITECATRETLFDESGTEYETFIVSDNFVSPIPQTNEFDDVGAYIDESDAGDYIEFFLTFNGGFPEDLISILNRRNPADDWVIVHQLSVFEQIGSSFIESSRQTFFQEGNFDDPLLFRPVLKNANEAVSMNIDYLVRLLNRRDGSQVIREASYTLLSPKKYGRELIKMPLQEAPQSQRIFNKLVKKDFEASKLFVEPDKIGNTSTDLLSGNTRVVEKAVFVPMFFENNNVALSNRSVSSTVKDEEDEIIFGQGKLRFILSPFDNFIKFKIFNIGEDDSINPFDLNVSSAKYYLVFNTQGGKIRIQNLGDQAKENLSEGEIMWKVPKKEAEAILEGNIREFYITSITEDGSETLIYSAQWNRVSEQSEVDAALAAAKAETEERKQTQSKIQDISDKIDKKQTDAQINLVTIAKPLGTKQINVDIPGYVRKKQTKLAGSVNAIKPNPDISKSKKRVRADQSSKSANTKDDTRNNTQN